MSSIDNLNLSISPVSIIPTAPDQESVWQLSRTQPRLLVTAEKGAGKTYALVSLALNALNEGEKVLIVCGANSSFHHIQRIINHNGFSDILLTLQDVKTDKEKLFEAYGVLSEAIRKKPNYDTKLFQRTYLKAKQNRIRINTANAALHKKMLLNKSWNALTSDFLELEKLQSKALLNNRLTPSDFDFTDTEFKHLVADIKDNRPLVLSVGTLNHPLNALNDQLFEIADQNQALDHVNTQLNSWIIKLERIQKTILAVTDQYRGALHNIYSEPTLKLHRSADNILLEISLLQSEYGKDFDDSGASSNVTLKVSSIFSGKTKELAAIKKDLREKIDTLIELYLANKLVEHNFSPIKGNVSFTKVTQNLQQFIETLVGFENQIPAIVKEETRRFSRETVQHNPHFGAKIREFDKEIETALTDLNKANIFAAQQRTEALTFGGKRDFIENVLANLKDLQANMRDFPKYYNWKRKWLVLDPKSKAVLIACMKVQPEDWVTAFQSWYLSHLLQKNYNTDLPTEGTFSDFDAAESFHVLRVVLPTKLVHEFRDRQGEAVQQMKSSSKELSKMLSGSSLPDNINMLNLKDIYSINPVALSNTFPFVLTYPDTAAQVFEGMDAPFDYVLIDEGHNLPDNLASLLALGKKQVVFSDEAYDDNKLPKAALLLDAYPYKMENYKAQQLFNETNFADVVVEVLGHYISPSRIQVNVFIDDIPVDILIKSEQHKQKDFLVLCDGLIRDENPNGIERSYGAMMGLINKGYTVYSLWSPDWAMNPEVAARKLASVVLSQKKVIEVEESV